MVKYLTSAPGFALAPGKAIGDVSALVLPDQPIMAHSGTSSPTTGRPCNMAQPAANGTSLFNGTDASTAPLRYALRALASEPDFLAAPHQVIARLRPRVDAEKRRLAQGRDMPGSPDERLRNWARLVDGAISGLTYLARVSVDADARTVVAPFAVMAVGQYGARRCEPEGTLELQYLLPDDQGSRERSRRIVAFIQIGLAEFGLQHRDAMSTVIECARAAHGDPAAAARLATARFLGGQYTLYVGFADRLGDPRAGCTDATRESRCSLGSARFRRSCRIQCHQSLAPDSTAGGGDGSASEGTGQ